MSEKNLREGTHDSEKNCGGRLAEQQERRIASSAQRDSARTKKQSNRDYERCPKGSLATD